MKKSILILIATLFASCSQDKNPDITLDQNSGDTLQVIKRYPSKKVKEIVLYKNNAPSSNLGLSEKGDTLKFPTAVYNKLNRSVFVFIPTQKQFLRIAVSLVNGDTLNDGSNPVFNVEPKSVGSFDIPITDEMIRDKTIQGIIRTMYDDKPMEVWPFKMTIE